MMSILVRGQTETEKEGHVKTEAEIEVACLKTKKHQEHLIVWNGFFSQSLQQESTLQTLALQTSDFQKCKRMNFCYFKLPGLLWFVMTTVGNKGKDILLFHTGYSLTDCSLNTYCEQMTNDS